MKESWNRAGNQAGVPGERVCMRPSPQTDRILPRKRAGAGLVMPAGQSGLVRSGGQIGLRADRHMPFYELIMPEDRI
jgi:hypothetical protein